MDKPMNPSQRRTPVAAEPVPAKAAAARQRHDPAEVIRYLRRSGKSPLEALVSVIGMALAQGVKPDVVRLFREAFGFTATRTTQADPARFGKQASAEPPPAALNGLSPGEMPRSRSGAWLAAIAASILAAYLFERFG
jgi:hypothetical protein